MAEHDQNSSVQIDNAQRKIDIFSSACERLSVDCGNLFLSGLSRGVILLCGYIEFSEDR